jgi:hypothetical protein
MGQLDFQLVQPHLGLAPVHRVARAVVTRAPRRGPRALQRARVDGAADDPALSGCGASVTEV